MSSEDIKVISVVGARPQFVKLAPVSKALRSVVNHVIVHTGQHYDDSMSDTFFRDLEIPMPDVNLEVGSGSHGAQTAKMLVGLEQVFEAEKPDCVLVYGDTNSTIAAALAAVKLHVPVAHLEAGLRSFNRRMPEEHNRVLTDHCSDLLLAPTQVAMDNLRNEGLSARSVLVGDVMTDVVYWVRDEVLRRNTAGVGGQAIGSYYLATIHRPDNTDDPERLDALLEAMSTLDRPVVLLVHPRLAALAERHGLALDRGVIDPRPPLGYRELVAATMGSAGVITDSGGLQKEAFLLRVPTITLRPETEWVETVDAGWNILVNDPALLKESLGGHRPSETDVMPYGDGNAASRVAETIITWFAR